MFEFMKSTRSIIAVMAMLLVFVVVIGVSFGVVFPNEIYILVGSLVGGVTTAYFGKRDSIEDQGGDITRTMTETSVPKKE